MIRIRFHGRGGQGMKTAGRIAGTAASLEGYNVQDFPLYGAERRGAPLAAYTRISDQTILERGVIHNPHIVIIADDSLLDDPAADPLRGTDNNTILVINTQSHPDVMVQYNITGTIVPIDATGISISVTGKGTAVSTAMGAAACRATGIISRESLAEAVTRELASIGITSDDVLKRNIEVAWKCFDSIASLEKRTWDEAPLPVSNTVVVPFDPPAISTPAIIASGNIIERQTGKWRTFKPVIDYDKCNNCWICFVWCPEGAINLDDNEAPHIDYDHCKGCLICYEECPVKAINMERESSG